MRHSRMGSGMYHTQASSKLECQDQQCAEEECDPEECGDETRGPRDDNYTCGIDRRPLLPVLLVISTLIGGITMVLFQFPLVREFWENTLAIRALFIFLYVVTIGCMVYCALCDPGQLKRDVKRKEYLSLQGGEEAPGGNDEEPSLPQRCHKTWLYQFPIRRYDHYCRWLTNCVGLLNHREFVTMCVGLVAIGVLGGALDAILVVLGVRRGSPWHVALCLILHLLYSIILVALAGPILRLHVGFISRNELAAEWKRNEFYIVHSSRKGENVPVNELSDDEFNDRFDSFQYEAKRNKFDKGISTNCINFWCVARWAPNQLGDY